jgi:HK97 family phage prohead protease
MNDKECRYVNINPDNFLKIEKSSRVEKRDDGTEETIEEDKMVLEGYPIVFDQETLIGDEDCGWIEVIRKQAMNGADMSDTPLKYNHQDITPILARVRNGSLKLTVDDHGLFMRAELLDTQQNKDFYKMVKAGLLDKMSFAFNVVKESCDNLSKPARREILGIGRLFDVSIVDVPAYDGTSLQARSKAIAEARAKAEADAEARALEELENSNKLKEEKAEAEARAFNFKKKKQIALLKLGGK